MYSRVKILNMKIESLLAGALSQELIGCIRTLSLIAQLMWCSRMWPLGVSILSLIHSLLPFDPCMVYAPSPCFQAMQLRTLLPGLWRNIIKYYTQINGVYSKRTGPSSRSIVLKPTFESSWLDRHMFDIWPHACTVSKNRKSAQTSML